MHLLALGNLESHAPPPPPPPPPPQWSCSGEKTPHRLAFLCRQLLFHLLTTGRQDIGSIWTFLSFPKGKMKASSKEKHLRTRAPHHSLQPTSAIVKMSGAVKAADKAKRHPISKVWFFLHCINYYVQPTHLTTQPSPSTFSAHA